MTDKATPAEELKHKVEELLNGLGENQNEVATSLEKEGCKGIQDNPRRCPLAEFLNRELGNGIVISVLSSLVKVRERNSANPMQSTLICSFDLSYPASSFIRGFDKGSYPQLIAD